MPTNDFLPFAGAIGANVISQGDYSSLPAQETGFQAGTAISGQLNKVWRQSSIIATMIATFIVDQTGDDVIDDGEAGIAAIEASFVNAIQNAVAQSGVPYGDDTGTTNNMVADVNPAPGSLGEGLSVLIRVANTNSGATQLNLQSFGNKPVQNADGTPLAAGQLTADGYALFVYDGTQFQMISMPGPAFFASLLAGGTYTAVDTGAADAIAADLGTPPASLGTIQYIPISIKVANANTGATTLDLNSLGATPVKNPDGTALVPGQLQPGMNLFAYDGTNFILLTPPGPKFFQKGTLAYAAAGGTANAITVTLNPVPTAIGAGTAVRFKAAADNTGATTLNVNGLGAVALKDAAGGALAGGEIITDGMYEASHNGTEFRMLSVPSNLGGSGRVIGRHRYTAGASYTPDPAATRIIVRAQGGGGAGGGAPSTGSGEISVGGGGAAGSFGEGEWNVADLTFPATITIGAGGTANSGIAGSAGGTTSMSGVVSCPGGQGGSVSSVLSAAGTRPAQGGVPGATPTFSGTPVWSSGAPGQPGGFGFVRNDEGTFRMELAGAGGCGFIGGGGYPPTTGGGSAGNAGAGPGAGGSGAVNHSSGGAKLGGAGAAGELIIWEFS